MRVPDVRKSLHEMPRTQMTACAAWPRTARRPGNEGVLATHEDRETGIMSGMDGSHGKRIPVQELMAGIEASRVSATLERAGA